MVPLLFHCRASEHKETDTCILYVTPMTYDYYTSLNRNPTHRLENTASTFSSYSRGMKNVLGTEQDFAECSDYDSPRIFP